MTRFASISIFVLATAVLLDKRYTSAQDCGCPQKSPGHGGSPPTDVDLPVGDKNKTRLIEGDMIFDDIDRAIYGGRSARQAGDTPDDVEGEQEDKNKTRLVEGDMIFDEIDRAIYAGFKAGGATQRRWPQGRVFYRMNDINTRYHGLIRNSLNRLSNATKGCVTFEEVPAGYRGPHVYVVDKGTCHSSIGRVSFSGQELSLGARGCMLESTIQHEFMHALGFYHEQSRPDRDNHVTINWHNIETDACYNFDRCRGCLTVTPYDHLSIMHYDGYSFGCRRNLVTIQHKSGDVIPWNYYLTALDVEKIRKYYQCEGEGASPVR